MSFWFSNLHSTSSRLCIKFLFEFGMIKYNIFKLCIFSTACNNMNMKEIISHNTVNAKHFKTGLH